MSYKFHVGQTVQLMQGTRYLAPLSTGYKVVRQLPEVNGEVSYRIKSARETHERVVRENQLLRG